jgi:hypothetical protein
MQRILIGLASAAFAVAASAAQSWTTPGWYVMVDEAEDSYIIGGPFADEASCKESLPPDESLSAFECRYLSEHPAWDK